jgi:molybdate transport system substrate-binding protein
VVEREPLRLFLPGAFAGMRNDLRTGFAAVVPGGELWFHAFVPSGMLAHEILEGAAADVYVSANVHFMAELWQAGLVAAPRVLAGNRLCLIVRPDRAANVRGLADVTREDLRLVTPQSATDPCGRYVVDLFARLSFTEAMAEKEAGGWLVHSRGSGDLPAFLFDGRADAGIFYASEAKALGDRVVTVGLPLDRDMSDQIVFVIGAVMRPDRTHPLAPAFVDFAIGSAGQALLARYGFLPASSVLSAQLPWARHSETDR